MAFDRLSKHMVATLCLGMAGFFIGEHLRESPRPYEPPTRLNIQYHWQEVHDPNWKIQNALDSKMLDRCSIECDMDYQKEMEK
jgi:hypothetical protein